MFTEKIASLWDQLKVVFSDFAFTDFLDICLVAFILYSVIKLIRETKAIQLAKGLLLFGVAYLAIYLLDMQASEFIFKKSLRRDNYSPRHPLPARAAPYARIRRQTQHNKAQSFRRAR